MSKLRNIWHAIRFGLVLHHLSWALRGKGVWIRTYYWYQEGAGSVTRPELRDTSEGYSFSFFGPEEMKIIAEQLAGRHEGELLDKLTAGKKCFGAKYHDQIAAFTWIDLKESSILVNNLRLNDHEAYLFDAVTMPSFRGKNIAPFVRYKVYEVLTEMGRDTFYSVSERSNPPAIKFKKKLGAKILWLGLYIEFFKKYHWNWVIKRY
ncbi:MAG: hypothetical protein HOC20_04540 [Chloroflexi bacterium]|jgi:ribosomal protein S18 acetylase RimI-like enzyme|nr:hypothetical protein [Chloroflexota bacterium]